MPNRQDTERGAGKAANQNVKGASFGGIHEILHQNDVNLARVPVFNVRYVTLQQRCGEALWSTRARWRNVMRLPGLGLDGRLVSSASDL